MLSYAWSHSSTVLPNGPSLLGAGPAQPLPLTAGRDRSVHRPGGSSAGGGDEVPGARTHGDRACGGPNRSIQTRGGGEESVWAPKSGRLTYSISWYVNQGLVRGKRKGSAHKGFCKNLFY